MLYVYINKIPFNNIQIIFRNLSGNLGSYHVLTDFLLKKIGIAFVLPDKALSNKYMNLQSPIP